MKFRVKSVSRVLQGPGGIKMSGDCFVPQVRRFLFWKDILLSVTHLYKDTDELKFHEVWHSESDDRYHTREYAEFIIKKYKEYLEFSKKYAVVKII